MRWRSAMETAGSGSGSMKMSRWSKAAISRVWSDKSMPLPNTSPDMSPTPTTVKGVVWMSRLSSRKCRFTASQRALGGDAHLLVVVAGRAAAGEGVVEPEAVLLADGVGGVGEGRRALVGGDDEVGIVGIAAHDVCRRHDVAAFDIVGDRQQAGDEIDVGVAAGLEHLVARTGLRSSASERSRPWRRPAR